jgi:hypothetical protein
VGATPRYQQLGLFAGVFASSFVIGLTLIGMNKGLERFVPVNFAVDVANPPEGVVVENRSFPHEGKDYALLNVIGSRTVPEGKYLLNTETGQVEKQWVLGIGSQAAPAPQARLMSVVINGILTRKLPWGLVLLGVFLVIVVELLGIRSLSFAVGSYLPFGTSTAIFCGGVVHWLANRGKAKAEEEGEASPGALYASGLIAAGGIVGLLAIGERLAEVQKWLPANVINVEARVIAPLEKAIEEAARSGSVYAPSFVEQVAHFFHSPLTGMLAFALLGFSLFHFARKPLQ